MLLAHPNVNTHFVTTIEGRVISALDLAFESKQWRKAQLLNNANIRSYVQEAQLLLDPAMVELNNLDQNAFRAIAKQTLAGKIAEKIAEEVEEAEEVEA